MKYIKKLILPILSMTLFSILIYYNKIFVFRNYFQSFYNIFIDTPKSVKYYKSGVIIDIIDTIWGILVPLIIIFSGISSKLRRFSYKAGKKRIFAIMIYSFLFVIIYYFLYFPLDFYRGFINKHIFSLSNQSIYRWLYSWILDMLTTGISLALILWIPYNLIKKYPSKWWFYTWLMSIPLVIMIIVVSPIVVDPLYNKFTPLTDINLKTKIESLASKANISGCSIFVVDKSKDTDAINAYMTGIGGTKRIVLWDTAIKGLPEKQLLFVVAHEMGHYVLKHVLISTLFAILSLLFLLFIIYRITPFLINKYGKKMKCNTISEITSLPLIILIITICIFVSEPISNAWSRKIEVDADTFAIELTRDNQAGIDAFENLSKNNLSIMQPDEWYKVWKYDHPPLQERIDFIRTYKPWEIGEQLKFERYFKK